MKKLKVDTQKFVIIANSINEGQEHLAYYIGSFCACDNQYVGCDPKIYKQIAKFEIMISESQDWLHALKDAMSKSDAKHFAISSTDESTVVDLAAYVLEEGTRTYWARS